MAKLTIHINPSSGVPIYRQIMDMIKDAIMSGQIKPGEQLPSIREVAESMTINSLTVLKAYNKLEAIGIISTKRGMGTFVADQPVLLSKKGRKSEIESRFKGQVEYFLGAGFSKEEIVEVLNKLKGDL